MKNETVKIKKEQRIKTELGQAAEGVEEQVKRIESFLQVYRAEANPTWGHVGSMKHAEATLKDLCDGLLAEYSM